MKLINHSITRPFQAEGWAIRLLFDSNDLTRLNGFDMGKASGCLLYTSRASQGIDGVGELLPRNDIGTPGIGEAGEGFAKYRNAIPKTGKQFCGGKRFLEEFAAAVGECQQMPGQVSTVDRGDVEMCIRDRPLI